MLDYKIFFWELVYANYVPQGGKTDSGWRPILYTIQLCYIMM